MIKKYNCYERTKKEGHTKSLVHGRMDEVICHDMRKFVWTQFEEKLKKMSNMGGSDNADRKPG